METDSGRIVGRSLADGGIEHKISRYKNEQTLCSTLWNIRLNNSLNVAEKYQKLENEKKNTRTVRKTHSEPMIRYQSLAMPVMVLANKPKVKETPRIDVPTEGTQTVTGPEDKSNEQTTET